MKPLDYLSLLGRATVMTPQTPLDQISLLLRDACDDTMSAPEEIEFVNLMRDRTHQTKFAIRKVIGMVWTQKKQNESRSASDAAA